MKRAKRFLSILLTLSMVLGLFPMSAFAAKNNTPFTDVNTGDWFYEAVEYVYECGMMSGTGETTFSPQTTTTRGMIVTILHRMEGTPEAAGEAFTDVDTLAYYADAVAWASESGIVGGYGNSEFGPNDPITREQMAAILYRYAQYLDIDVSVGEDTNILSYGDAEQVSEWAVEALQWAVSAGLINGIDGNLVPQGSATRAQVATILMRFCEGGGSVTEDVHTVTFQYNYGSKGVYKEVQVTDGETVDKPDNPDRKNYTFKGWYTAKSGGEKFNFGTPVTEDITLWARWKKVEEKPVDPPAPEPETFTVTFESNGGSEVDPITVEAGSTVTQPEDPTKENCTFVGWYYSDGFSEGYDFDQQIHSDTIVYAKWYDETNTTDSDTDGLSDALEQEFGTDPSRSDSDNDGLDDFIELDWLNYNPLLDDSDGNGIPDAEEDPDEDGLTNQEESYYGTIPIYWDTDSDCLSDYEEVKTYQTNPLLNDTDGDGVDDGTEVEIGSDPLVQETRFNTSESCGTVDDAVPVAASATVTTDADGAGELFIDEVSTMDNPVLSRSIPGYLGSAYDFSTEGKLLSAKITFTYDKSLGQIGENFQPRIYYFNEESGLLEELPNQTVANGSVSADVSHFSTYILLNKVEFDKVWEAEIKNPQNQEESQYTGIDVVFVIDSSGSMDWNDGSGLRKQAAKAFVNKLGENDRAAVVDFDSYASVYQGFTNDYAKVNSAIDKVNSSGGTSLSAGMSVAINLYTSNSYTRTDAYKYIIFLTDGDGSYSTSYTKTAKDNNIVVYTIGLGSEVEENTLRAIADGTGGKYYFATTADALSDIYAEVSFETVDYTTDSNNDGISDYYTKLLNDGVLPLSAGSFDLIEVTEMYGEESDDWDNDGLKNGEEIQVCVTGNRVYVKMTSHPLLIDTDGDGYSDAEEKAFGTSPMKYTSDAWSALQGLENDSAYVYIDVANDRGVISSINAFFDWKKTDEAKEQLIDYFYDYASKETIDKNQDKIADLSAREEYLKYAQSLANIAKTARNICTIADDVSGMVEGISNTGDAQNFVDDLKSKKEVIKGTSAQVRASRQRILDAMNSNQLSDTDILKMVLKDADATRTAIEEFGSLFEEYDAASFSKDLTSAWATATSGVAMAVGTVKTCYEGFKYIKLDTGFKKISDGYQQYLKKKGTTSTATYVGVALDVIDGGIEIWDTVNTYGKMKANRDAYIAYIELLYHITEYGTEKYDRVAADAIAQIVQDETWSMYEKQLMAANGKTAVLTTLSIVADLCPYTKAAKAVYDIGKLTINITGLGNNARLIVSCRTMQAVSDGCISIVDKGIERTGQFFSYGANEYSYLVQLAQSRLVGENFAKERLLKGDLAVIIARWLEGTGKDDIDDMFRVISGVIYSNASRLNLKLSNNLPYYSDFA